MSSQNDSDDDGPGSVFLVSYPKIVFLYPTVLAALFGAIYMMAKGGDPSAEYASFPGRLFLLVFLVNLVVISFDFPRTTSLTWFFAAIAIAIGLWTLFRLNPDFAPWVTRQMMKITPAMNTSFYVLYVLLMMFLFVCVIVSRRFDYWEVRGNELLHHHGILSDLERFSAPNLRIDKEINDVFEYLLLRSGRLILHPSQERRAIVLENVFFINQKEEQITRMLGALQVRVRTDK
ncbi:MAG: hypothetical protein KDA81_10530 [Planctomycetaceae bacterium]|nr:hypothetical protein [Planctomycetaceae bacterium]